MKAFLPFSIIYEMDAGIDTGPIIAQKMVKFGAQELSFASTYHRLITEIKGLFIENMDDIVNLRWSPKKQQSQGSYHSARDLPADLSWNMDIKEYLLSHNRPIPKDAWE
jgi:methionyl-tRNA formyltransferase